MTDWMWMTKEGIAEPAMVTRESFEMCHAPYGWVEHIPPEPVDDSSEPETAVTAEPETPTTTRTSRRAAATEEK